MKVNVLILVLSVSALLTACGKEEQKPMPSEYMDTVIDLEETPVNESKCLEDSVGVSVDIQNITEEETEAGQMVQQYSNASIYFEYPVEWVLTEQQGEDGTCVSIVNPNEKDGADFTLVQGEAWRVNLDYKKEDYVQFLSEKYEELEITDLSTIIIDGYDAKKLQFTYKANEQKYAGTKYIVVVDLVSFEITYRYPLEKAKEYEMQGESILASIQFTVAKSAIQQAFLSVLLSEQPFFYTDKYVGQDREVLHTYNGYLKELPFDERIMTFPRFSIVDMDGDDVPEIVLEMENYLGFVVLRYKDGKIQGNEFWYRWLIDLRENGTFLGTSGAEVYTIGKLYFVNDTFVDSDKLHRQYPSYYLHDVPVTQETFKQLEAEIFTDVPQVEWYDFTEESIKQHITESPLFVEVPEEKALRMQQRQEYMDSLSYLVELKCNYIGDSQEEKNENAKQYYYECKEELEKIYKLCEDNFQQKERTILKKEQQYWEEGIEKRLVEDLLRYDAYSIEDLKEQWLYYDYGDMYLRRTLYLINCYYGCDFYD